MKRQVSLEEISDGRLYDLNDMVKADCKNCERCSSCCEGMGSSIVLTPLDIYALTKNMNCTFEQLMAEKIELNVVDGMILPNLKMSGVKEKCAFLTSEGRCSIHAFRPGICRIFPLGRYYDEKGFRYFLQIHECKKENRGKIKVRKWIDIPDLKQHEKFIMDWHTLLMELEERIQKSDDAEIKSMNMFFLNLFFVKCYDMNKDFYIQFQERSEMIKKQYQLQ